MFYERINSLHDQHFEFSRFHIFRFSLRFLCIWQISLILEGFRPIWRAWRHQVSRYAKPILCATRYTSKPSPVQFSSRSDTKWSCMGLVTLRGAATQLVFRVSPSSGGGGSSKSCGVDPKLRGRRARWSRITCSFDGRGCLHTVGKGGQAFWTLRTPPNPYMMNVDA